MADQTNRKRGRPGLSESERKRRKLARNKDRQQSRVFLGSEKRRWNEIKSEQHLKTDREVATFLIDSYLSTKDVEVTESLTEDVPSNYNFDKNIGYEDSGLKMECEETESRTIDIYITNSDPVNTSLSRVESPIELDTENIKLEAELEVITNTADNVIDNVPENVTECSTDSKIEAPIELDTENIKPEAELEVITNTADNVKDNVPENVTERSSDSEYDSDDEYNLFANMAEQNIETIALQCNNTETSDKRTSARLLSKGFRPNYASLAKWKTDESDNTSEDSDSDFSDFDFDGVDENTEINENQNSSEIDKGKRKRNREDEFVDKAEVKKQNVGDKSGDIDKVHRDNKPKTREVKMRENKTWKSIKLEDYPDKFRMEKVGSFEQRNRCNKVVEEFYVCLLCGKYKINNKAIFEKHLEKHINGLFNCSQCDFIGRSELEAVLHRRSQHSVSNKKNKSVCHLCGVTFNSSVECRKHLGKDHNEPQYKCQYCDLKLVSKGSRKTHLQNLHGDLVQWCNICREYFHSSTPEEFVSHKSYCKPGHPCHICGKMIVSKLSLEHHIKSTHMNCRMFQCNMCQYAAKSGMRMRDHMLTHTNSHPYSCDQCSFTCVQSYQLTSHQRTHTGVKPYKCTQCNYAAAWNVQLKDHVKVHSMNTSVLCEPCNILFKNNKAKKLHDKKEH